MRKHSFSSGPTLEMNRAGFIRSLAFGSLALSALRPLSLLAAEMPSTPVTEKPPTNGKDAAKVPRNRHSMPGLFPGRVVQVHDGGSISAGNIQGDRVEAMLVSGICRLTGEKDVRDAWRSLVSPGEMVGLKVNPVAGPALSTSIELTQALVRQLEKAGLSRRHLLIWDRREPQLEECGFTSYQFPGIRILGTERTDRTGSPTDPDGKLYGESMLDKNWFYWAAVNGEYDAETLPWMLNGGEYSFFTKIVTTECDKIINLPILKNAGSSITMCLKNLAYGSISNTGRLHEKLWAETSAEVCSFAPLRDKVVLNIADGLKGCYQGGPGADPRYICDFNTLLLGTDPVAVDRIGYEIILARRIAEQIQQKDQPKARAFMDLAAELGLGEARLDHIDLQKIDQ